jgi:hypothetical protein
LRRSRCPHRAEAGEADGVFGATAAELGAEDLEHVVAAAEDVVEGIADDCFVGVGA